MATKKTANINEINAYKQKSNINTISINYICQLIIL